MVDENTAKFTGRLNSLTLREDLLVTSSPLSEQVMSMRITFVMLY